VNSELPRLIAACRHYAPATTATDNKRFAEEARILLAFHSHEKGIQIQVYDVSFHGAK
jgi:hypothetical protein